MSDTFSSAVGNFNIGNSPIEGTDGVTQILPIPRPQFTDGNGAPLVGGSVAYCVPGSGGNSFKGVFADKARTIPLQNPVPLDAAGIAFSGGSQVSVWGAGPYEVFVRDASGVLMYSALIDTNP